MKIAHVSVYVNSGRVILSYSILISTDSFDQCNYTVIFSPNKIRHMAVLVACTRTTPLCPPLLSSTPPPPSTNPLFDLAVCVCVCASAAATGTDSGVASEATGKVL